MSDNPYRYRQPAVFEVDADCTLHEAMQVARVIIEAQDITEEVVMEEYERGLRDGLTLTIGYIQGYAERRGLRGDAAMHFRALCDELRAGERKGDDHL